MKRRKRKEATSAAEAKRRYWLTVAAGLLLTLAAVKALSWLTDLAVGAIAS